MSDNNPRAQVLGKLVQEAREHAGRSVADCAQILNISPKVYEKAESGEHQFSLPDLELLALYLKVPMGYFWGSENLTAQLHVDYANLATLRHRVIGVLLHQQRLKERRSVQDLADELGVPSRRIEAYEAGEESIPYLDLETLSKFLNVSVDHFLDADRGPLGRHETEMRLLKQFNSLSPELQAFIANPQNNVYLDTAQRLSVMDVKQLRQIAESILEITW
ncbi:MAG: helix-turn-helix transcriptional regulator [Chloroflexota bacterium]